MLIFLVRLLQLKLCQKTKNIPSGIYFCGLQESLKNKIPTFKHFPRSQNYTEFKIISDRYVVCKTLIERKKL